MKGARLNNIDEYNQSALLLSVYSENNQLVEYFLSKKADPNEIFYNRSYLYRAVLKNNFEMTKLLVKYGADVNYVDGRHRTIYSYAMEYADDDIIDYGKRNIPENQTACQHRFGTLGHRAAGTRE